MTNDIFRENEIAVEVIATGSTLDSDPGFKGKIYEIRTWTFRLNHIGLNRWIHTDTLTVWPECYETREEYEAVKAEKERQREELEEDIRILLGITGDGVTIAKNIAEIYTAVQIQEIAEPKTEEPKKASVAERLQRSASMLNAMLCCMI